VGSDLVALRLRPEVIAELRTALDLPADASGPDAIRAAITRLTGMEPSQMVMPRGGYRPRRSARPAQEEAA